VVVELNWQKIFLPSPRNSEEAHVSLLERLQCTKLVVTEPQPPCVPMILKSIKLQTINLPSLQQLLTVGDVEEYPYTKTFIDAQDDPAYVLHTSGSTGKLLALCKTCDLRKAPGIPKPLIYTPRFVSKLLAQCQLAAPEGFVRLSRYSTMGKFVCILPPFHVSCAFGITRDSNGVAYNGTRREGLPFQASYHCILGQCLCTHSLGYHRPPKTLYKLSAMLKLTGPSCHQVKTPPRQYIQSLN